MTQCAECGELEVCDLYTVSDDPYNIVPLCDECVAYLDSEGLIVLLSE